MNSLLDTRVLVSVIAGLVLGYLLSRIRDHSLRAGRPVLFRDECPAQDRAHSEHVEVVAGYDLRYEVPGIALSCKSNWKAREQKQSRKDCIAIAVVFVIGIRAGKKSGIRSV